MGVVNVSFVGVFKWLTMSLLAGFIYLFTILFSYCTALPLWNQDALSKSPSNTIESNEYLKDQGIILMLRDGNNSSNSTTAPDSLEDCRTSGLCPEGIANIVAGLSAVFFLGVLACVLWHWEIQLERKTRVRLALERNRTIDRQMVEDKKKRQDRVDNFIAKSQQRGEGEGEEERTIRGGASLVEKSLQEVTSDSELSSDEHKQLLSEKTRVAQELTVAAEIS